MTTISIDVDLQDIWYDIADKHLLAEVSARKLEMPDDALQSVRAVINLLKAGETEEAILRLEREFWPKWKEPGESKLAYLRTLAPANDNAPQEAAVAVSA